MCDVQDDAICPMSFKETFKFVVLNKNENGFFDKALYLLPDLGEVVRRPYLYTGGAGQVEVPGGRTEGPPKAEEQEVRIIFPCTAL